VRYASNRIGTRESRLQNELNKPTFGLLVFVRSFKRAKVTFSSIYLRINCIYTSCIIDTGVLIIPQFFY